ncbi:MAG TPA: alkaline phosphatase family protein [Candidatus Binatia bacterium]|nr:alkaline phosphatase family protein [Candidatus Binatia bacterium]
MRSSLVLAGLLALAPAAVALGAAVCPFEAGALPAATLPPGAPHGSAIPIDTIVVMMQENRSFDHYFGQLHRQGQPDAEAEPRRATNPDPRGGRRPVRPFHQTRYCEKADLDHSWNGTHAEWNGDAMDGFTAANVAPNDPKGRRAMGYYTKRDLPFYYELYATFAIGDRYFSSLLSQTFPNRFYLLAGTSFGHIRNDIFDVTDPTSFAQRTIFNLLDEAVPPVTWKVYQSQVPFAILFGYVRANRSANLVPIDRFYADAAAGTLPQVAFVDPIFTSTDPNVETDEHPPSNVQVGQAFAAKVIGALMMSPQWPRAALFHTYDEHGGFYDHVPPPEACVPDDIPPMLRAGDVDARFDRLGIRVPVAVVSPWARKRFVSHTVHDHTSILRFIETRFDLPALTRRDANADPMLEFFDFTSPAFATPPRLPKARIDKRRMRQCAKGPSNGAF